jgi:hypothetical protein
VVLAAGRPATVHSHFRRTGKIVMAQAQALSKNHDPSEAAIGPHLLKGRPWSPAHRGIACALLAILGLAFGCVYALKLPWGGDEWYTYHDFALMALPNHLLVALAKRILGEVTPHNYLAYRLIGAIWFVASFTLLFALIRKGALGTIPLLHGAFLALSAFMLLQFVFFRYYGLYLFAAVGSFYLLYRIEQMDYTRARKWLYLWLFLSPLVHFFLTWQVLIYTVLKEWLYLRPGKRVALCLVALGLIAVVFAFRKDAFGLALHLAYSGQPTSAQSAQMRGLSAGLLVKPFYDCFRFVFGDDLEPTEGIVIAGTFVLLGLCFLYRLAVLRTENRPLFNLIVMAGILPLLAMHWLLEPITPPGSTQLEPHHALFFAPLLIAALAPPCKSLSQLPAFLGCGLLLLGSGLGLAASLTAARIDWPRAVQMAAQVQGKGGVTVLDGRSQETFRFYGQGLVDPAGLVDIYSLDNNRKAIEQARSVMAVLNDWKAYQPLTLAQNWNSGADNAQKYQATSKLITTLRAHGPCQDTYIQFPLFALVYGQDVAPGGGVTQPKPGVFGLPYQDVTFPMRKDGVEILGWQDVDESHPFRFEANHAGRLTLFYLLQAPENLRAGETVGKIVSGKKEIPLVVSEIPSDAFQRRFSVGLRDGIRWYRWRKRPIVTQSLRFPGSLFSSWIYLFRSEYELGKEGQIIIDRPGIVMHLSKLLQVKPGLSPH